MDNKHTAVKNCPNTAKCVNVSLPSFSAELQLRAKPSSLEKQVVKRSSVHSTDARFRTFSKSATGPLNVQTMFVFSQENSTKILEDPIMWVFANAFCQHTKNEVIRINLNRSPQNVRTLESPFRIQPFFGVNRPRRRRVPVRKPRRPDKPTKNQSETRNGTKNCHRRTK